MVLLNRTAILAKHFRLVRDVDVPEWGGSVRMQAMSAKERDDFEADSFVETVEVTNGAPVSTRKLNTRNIRARLVAKCMIDEVGNRLFGDDEVDQLGGEDSSVLSKLFQVAQEMNGLGVVAKAEAEKNLPAPSADSPSDSV